MFITLNDIARVKANAGRAPYSEGIAQLTKKCDSLVSNPFPETDITLHNWTLERARVLLSSTVSLGLMYGITGNKAYARRAADFLLESIDWELWFYKTGVNDCSPYDLGTGETAMAFAISLPLICDVMTDAEHTACLAAMNKRVLTPYFDNTVPGDVKLWWHHNLNNWNCVCNGGMLAIASYMINCRYEVSRCEEAEKRALGGFEVYLNHMHEDGSCEEGTGYWGYATNYFVMALLYWENARGRKHPFFDSEKAGRWLRFPFIITPKSPLSFGDVGHFRPSGQLFAFAARMNDQEMLAELASYTSADASPWKLALRREPEPGTKRPTLPAQGLTWFPDNGWAIFVNGDIAMSFRSGTTKASHAQKDLNSVQLVRNGVQLLSNIGNHPYSVGWFGPARHLYWEENTTSKNSQLLNGIGQITNADAKFCREGDAIASDCAAAHHEYAVSVKRTASVDGEGFLLYDEFEVRQEMWHEDRFLTYGRFTKISETEFFIERDGEKAKLVFECDVPIESFLCDALPSTRPADTVHVLRVRTQNQVYESKWSVRILPE